MPSLLIPSLSRDEARTTQVPIPSGAPLATARQTLHNLA
jgi:hypothetical protein